jgi:hypothetical protein
MTVVHLLNRSPTKSLQGKTLYKAAHTGGRAPPHVRLPCVHQGDEHCQQAKRQEHTGCVHRLH